MKMKEITAKLMALALCGCMTCSFAACGSSGNTSSKERKALHHHNHRIKAMKSLTQLLYQKRLNMRYRKVILNQ